MRLTLGPVLYNWPVDEWRDFYARIADEAAVDTVVVGETVCAKRLPFFEALLPEIIERLQSAGKDVVLATLGLIMTEKEREVAAQHAATEGVMIEANDISVVAALAGRSFHVGPMMNVYNEGPLAFLAGRGAARVTLPPELPASSVSVLAGAGAAEIEVQAFGRVPLAISARCYHARARNLHKDGCQYVCAEDPDGMTVETLDGEPFLAVNGVQTMSLSYLNLAAEVESLAAMGVSGLRLSPQHMDMVSVSQVFRDLLDGRLSIDEADGKIAALSGDVPFSNGFFHGREGRAFTADSLQAE
ncbi:MAG: U32 family peptidase [Rhodospirillaceae bacterium]|nr:U32 family peptidase [Rhodospirillaceae bacterium]